MVGAGTTYQAVASTRDAASYQPPGELIDIGTHKLHLYCVGAGTPTVILDHASASLSGQWALIQPELGRLTRTCSYDRSGYGWSETGPTPYDAAQQAEELHQLLRAAGETAPFVHVGHSSGAFIGPIYNARYPGDIAGLVMVEPGYAWATPGVPAKIDAEVRSQETQAATVNLLATRIGLGRVLAPMIMGENDLPGKQGDAFDALALTTRQFETFEHEVDASESTSHAVLDARNHLTNVPLTVISAEQAHSGPIPEAMQAAHARIAAQSGDGQHVTVAGTDHMGVVLDSKPASVVTDEIGRLLEKLRLVDLPA
jgi:pimeloyl-ACP methyl ester carboxylesterase